MKLKKLIVTALLLVIASQSVGGIAASAAYTPSSAVVYARAYALDRNPRFQNLTGDCANFVSQCLYFGNLDMNSTWKSQKVNGLWVTTNAWAYSINLYGYTISSGRGSSKAVYTKNTYPTYTPGMELGDIIFYDWDGDGRIDHTSIVTKIQVEGTGPVARICQHTKDRFDVTWNLRAYMTKDELKKCIYHHIDMK